MKLLIDIWDLKINEQVCVYSPADLNILGCVELTFLEDKLDRLFFY